MYFLYLIIEIVIVLSKNYDIFMEIFLILEFLLDWI